METNIDCLKYRKSSHLARVDVEMIIAEKKQCLLTIKLAYYEKGVLVNGKKTDAYFLRFEEPNIKEMICNSTNRKKIAKIVQQQKNCTAVESRNIANWNGLKISLKVDENIKFAGEVVGGIVVDTNFIEKTKTIDEIKTEFASVTDRTTFESTMQKNKTFLQNTEINQICKELSLKYPKI